MIRREVLGAVVLAALSFIGCKKAPPADSVCSYDPLPAGAEVPSGQGGVQVMAATDSYFYAFDGAGKQIAYQGANAAAAQAGDYQIKINNTTHPFLFSRKRWPSAPLEPCLAPERPTSITTFSTEPARSWHMRSWARRFRFSPENIRGG